MGWVWTVHLALAWAWLASSVWRHIAVERLEVGRERAARFLEGPLRRWEILLMAGVVLLPPLMLMTGDPEDALVVVGQSHIRWKLMGSVLVLLVEAAGLRAAHRAALAAMGAGDDLPKAKAMARGTDTVFFLMAGTLFWLSVGKGG